MVHWPRDTKQSRRAAGGHAVAPRLERRVKPHSGVALAFDHEVSDDAVRVDLVLVGHLVAKRLVEPWCLEAEGFQVEAEAAVLSGPTLERANETGSSAPVTRLGLDPKLLEFTALATSARLR